MFKKFKNGSLMGTLRYRPKWGIYITATNKYGIRQFEPDYTSIYAGLQLQVAKRTLQIAKIVKRTRRERKILINQKLILKNNLMINKLCRSGIFTKISYFPLKETMNILIQFHILFFVSTGFGYRSNLTFLITL